MSIVIGLISLLFYEQHFSFFEQVRSERDDGATWEYVGQQKPDADAESIVFQCIDGNNEQPCGEPYILWKLKK